MQATGAETTPLTRYRRCRIAEVFTAGMSAQERLCSYENWSTDTTWSRRRALACAGRSMRRRRYASPCAAASNPHGDRDPHAHADVHADADAYGLATNGDANSNPVANPVANPPATNADCDAHAYTHAVHQRRNRNRRASNG
jgi:hypothetical protein